MLNEWVDLHEGRYRWLEEKEKPMWEARRWGWLEAMTTKWCVWWNRLGERPVSSLVLEEQLGFQNCRGFTILTVEFWKSLCVLAVEIECLFQNVTDNFQSCVWTGSVVLGDSCRSYWSANHIFVEIEVMCKQYK